MAIITRDFLMKNVSEVKPEVLSIPEWGGDILIERAKAAKAMLYRERLASAADEFSFIITFCINEDGTPLFTEDDIDWLKNQPISIINKIVGKIMEVNGFTSDIQEEAEKNSKKAES